MPRLTDAFHVRWDDLEWETVTDKIRRKLVTANEMMIAQTTAICRAVLE